MLWLILFLASGPVMYWIVEGRHRKWTLRDGAAGIVEAALVCIGGLGMVILISDDNRIGWLLLAVAGGAAIFWQLDRYRVAYSNR